MYISFPDIFALSIGVYRVSSKMQAISRLETGQVGRFERVVLPFGIDG
jgi:hypothetical protein